MALLRKFVECNTGGIDASQKQIEGLYSRKICLGWKTQLKTNHQLAIVGVQVQPESPTPSGETGDGTRAPGAE